MKKKMLLGLIILVTTGLTYTLVLYIGVLGFQFAWILNFMLMMCVLMFTETLKSKGDSGYYKTKDWENKGKIYETFGINLFRKLLVLVGWEKLNKKANPVKNDLESLIHLEYRTKQSELGHLIIFFIVLGFTIYVALKFTFAKSLWLLVLNVIFNLYPILLQRYNRPRLQRALKLFRYKAEQSGTA
ncbi:hypothetical protein [Flavobacterium pectinovorum]|uniref:glycosyl-4,4'-diaponeurosporenoate acyltransferase CrtO family protein n=1 Tax=Flavobacterium pectinovorum TaxID=29533 RepID=UPI001FAC7678|nr:hypothetical protein [Flavobacterium pectinovorum]MCI9844862.1 hypothetical protein [Flavobacterium pectinovorum]